jgi:hypothetical protein
LGIKLVENPDALPEDQQIDAVDKNPFDIQYIYSPSEPVQLAAVDASRGAVLRIIRNQTEAAQWRALHYHCELLEAIRDPSEEMAIFAIKNTKHPRPWLFLKMIDNPTDKMLWAALHKDPKSLTHLTRYSEEMALYAIEQDPELISKINNTTAKMRETAIAEQPSVISYHIVPWTLDELASVVKDYPDYINYVPSEKKQAVLQRISELRS